MIGFYYDPLIFESDSEFENEEPVLIAKATDEPVEQIEHQSQSLHRTLTGKMDKLFRAAKKKLGGSSNSLRESRDLIGENALHHSNSTRTRQTTVSSLQLEVATGNGTGSFERPESDEEIGRGR